VATKLFLVSQRMKVRFWFTLRREGAEEYETNPSFAPQRLRVRLFHPHYGNLTMTENEIGTIVVDCALRVHKKLGPGLLESVYEVALAHELRKEGFVVERQVPIPIVYDDLIFDEGFRADIIVAGTVLLELKSVEDVRPVHKKQVLTYLRLSSKRLGYLINFGSELLKDGVSRIANGVEDWKTDRPAN